MLAFDELCFAVRAGHFELALCLQLAITHDHVYLVLLHQELDAPAHFVGNTAAALDDGRKIRLAAGLDPELFCMLDIFNYLCALEQGLGGNATPVQANAAQTFFFNDRCLKAKLCGADSSYISAGDRCREPLHRMPCLPFLNFKCKIRPAKLLHKAQTAKYPRVARERPVGTMRWICRDGSSKGFRYGEKRYFRWERQIFCE